MANGIIAHFHKLKSIVGITMVIYLFPFRNILVYQYNLVSSYCNLV
jgi:hypothetical protein